MAERSIFDFEDWYYVLCERNPAFLERCSLLRQPHRTGGPGRNPQASRSAHHSTYFQRRHHIHTCSYHSHHPAVTGGSRSRFWCHPTILPRILSKLFYRATAKLITAVRNNRIFRGNYQGKLAGETQAFSGSVNLFYCDKNPGFLQTINKYLLRGDRHNRHRQWYKSHCGGEVSLEKCRFICPMKGSRGVSCCNLKSLELFYCMHHCILINKLWYQKV
mmetsp:Transcript_2762/g.6602  ORF Transcript_2762/g.6602 Transcript_2762/m.6602 type:complete len:218 (-) Transcript_2762:814-1467(-)